MKTIFSRIFVDSRNCAIDLVSEVDWGVLLLDRARSKAFFSSEENNHRVETNLSVMLDMIVGNISLIIRAENPSTPQDFDFIPWMTFTTSASLTSIKSKEVQLSVIDGHSVNSISVRRRITPVRTSIGCLIQSFFPDVIAFRSMYLLWDFTP